MKAITMLLVAIAARALGHAAEPAVAAYAPRPVAVPKDAPYVQPDGSILIVGNDGMQEMLASFNALFVRAHPGFKFTLLCKGSSTAIGGLTANVSVFGPSGREAWPVELEPFRRLYGYLPSEIRIGRNGFAAPGRKHPPAVYVNAKNPLASLTMEQVARVFTTGQAGGDFTHWNQVSPGGAERAIHPYGPRDDGGFATALRASRMNDLPFARAYEGLPKYADVLRAVADDANGVGVVGYCEADAVPSGVKRLALAESLEAAASLATYDEVRAGRYPWAPYLRLYVNRPPGAPLDPLVKEYARLVLSREGQAIIAALKDTEEGYVPLTAAEVAAELAKLE